MFHFWLLMGDTESALTHIKTKQVHLGSQPLDLQVNNKQNNHTFLLFFFFSFFS